MTTSFGDDEKELTENTVRTLKGNREPLIILGLILLFFVLLISGLKTATDKSMKHI